MAELGLNSRLPGTSVHASNRVLCCHLELGRKRRRAGNQKRKTRRGPESLLSGRPCLLCLLRLLLDEGDTKVSVCLGHYLSLESCPQRTCQAMAYLRAFPHARIVLFLLCVCWRLQPLGQRSLPDRGTTHATNIYQASVHIILATWHIVENRHKSVRPRS